MHWTATGFFVSFKINGQGIQSLPNLLPWKLPGTINYPVHKYQPPSPTIPQLQPQTDHRPRAPCMFTFSKPRLQPNDTHKRVLPSSWIKPSSSGSWCRWSATSGTNPLRAVVETNSPVHTARPFSQQQQSLISASMRQTDTFQSPHTYLDNTRNRLMGKWRHWHTRNYF